ncbi:MAG: hypothetical protein GX957_02560 [Clostridiaceae bacterium]|nr:hypothetical protein [Clostridiaceae bacterium]
MPSFRVDYVKDINGLADYLQKRIENNQGSSFRIKRDYDETCLIILLDGCIRKGGKKYITAINCISDILSEYILKSYEKGILEKIVNRICSGLPKTEKDEIFRIVCTRIYTQQSEVSSRVLIENRKKIISAELASYLRNADTISLEGFITFRLGKYIRSLEIEVEHSIRQYFIERQYEEYIKLLTAFVRMQVPRVPELHVFAQKDGSYKVEGTSPFGIPDDIIEGFGIDEYYPIIDNDDFMIGFLLTCAPVKIFIHNSAMFRNKELLNTIRIVFSECVIVN